MNKYILSSVLLGFAFCANAALTNPDWIAKEESVELKHILEKSTARERTLTIHIKRIRREGAPPVIISHAVVLNNHAMREWGHRLWEKGYDVWMPNLRAHGVHEELSSVAPYFEGDYQFDSMVTEDLPLIFQHVLKETKQKIRIVGYSMGGMTWEQFLSGVYKKNGMILQSDSLARERNSYVHSFIGIVVPPDLENVSDTVKNLLGAMKISFEPAYFVPLTPMKFKHEVVSSTAKAIHELLFAFCARRIYARLPYGIIEGRNLDNPAEDFKDLVINGLSSPHTDFIKDFMRWFYNDYASRDAHVNYGMNKKVFAPTLMIAATRDSLAPSDKIIAKSKLYPNEAHVQVLVVEDFAHLDINFRRGIEGFQDTVFKFLEDPKQKLPSHPELGIYFVKKYQSF